MNALKCDRCGKLYESYFLTTDLTNVGKDYRHYRIEVQRIPDKYSSHLDLCKDCEKELIRWVETKPPKTHPIPGDGWINESLNG